MVRNQLEDTLYPDSPEINNTFPTDKNVGKKPAMGLVQSLSYCEAQAVYKNTSPQCSISQGVCIRE